MPQWHPRVAKRASIGTLALGPSTEALLGQGRVPKGRESVSLTGLWSSLRPGLARHPPATDSSEAGPRGEEGFYRHFGTGIPPTSTSEASQCGKEGIYRHFGTGTPPKSTSEASQCGEEGLPTYPLARDPQQNHLRDGSARRRNLFSNKDY